MLKHLQHLVSANMGRVQVFVDFTAGRSGDIFILTEVDSLGIVLFNGPGDQAGTAYPWASIKSISPA